ncbi:restriction endonuclease subunit S [Lutibacter maritimus]|uniref:Type I restriction enzyme, S subunit n=1 Tax=Lutibacter maritimus TaxID=593133 RepID=A0A1I6SQT4_9FLAO|nr:restriction endonuclease subunit S [Lutibacter maritimus]SFS79249.1 type I restriction enzyme, S subunit [Lutibacter maritimus]
MKQQHLDLKNLEKTNWKTFRFDEIAEKVSETVDPNTTDLEIYIGLEHIDAESIHIKRYGTPADVKGGKLKCYPGDVIFGKRRAYQRKAAIVDFEGICSAHAFVLRAIPKVMHPDLFPFFLHSDLFMHCAVDISVGGLSPTINWGQLKEQKFLLPPKDQQQKLAKLLWAMDEVVEKELEVLEKLELTFNCIIKDIFTNRKSFVKLKTINFDYFKGLSLEEDENGKYLLTPSGAVFPGFLKNEKLKKVSVNAERNFEKILIKNDILFNTGGVGTLGRSHFFIKENYKYFCDSFVLVLRINDDKFLNKFIYFVFQSASILSQIIQNTKGTTGITSISIDSINNFKIPNLNIDEQKRVVNKLDKLEDQINLIQNKIENSKALQKSLINQVF